MAEQTIGELLGEYQVVCKKFKESQSNSEKDESALLQTRINAQAGFHLARKLKAKYETLLPTAAPGSKQAQEFEQNIAFYEKQIRSWTEWLQKYGSPMSELPSTTFDDIAGLDDVKETIKNYLFMLKRPEVAKAYHINTNLGILLYGPPGTGKTLIAEAIAHELGVRYFVITPSQIFGSYVGESEKNVRAIFAELRACTDGAVLLIDECESIFARREGDSNRAAIGVANQLLQEMNGQGDSEVSRRVIIGATNRPELMDEAYLRFKRFSLQFYIGMPAPEAKEKVVKLNLAKRPHEPAVMTELIARLRNDDCYTCADISGIVERCAYLALEDCRKRAEANGIGIGDELKSSDIVKIRLDHLNKVYSTYPKSVTLDMLQAYEEFKERRERGF